MEETKTAKEFHSKLQLNVTWDENDNASFIMLVMRVVALSEARNVTHIVNVQTMMLLSSILMDQMWLQEIDCGCLVSQ